MVIVNFTLLKILWEGYNFFLSNNRMTQQNDFVLQSKRHFEFSKSETNKLVYQAKHCGDPLFEASEYSIHVKKPPSKANPNTHPLGRRVFVFFHISLWNLFQRNFLKHKNQQRLKGKLGNQIWVPVSLLILFSTGYLCFEENCLPIIHTMICFI